MIELRHVTKRYGAVEALHDVSFRAPEGQIVGLLGQNGAGKSTTLNILTGYLPPTSGQVLVDGMDLLQNARECKRLIGYLPEKPPLYDEMTVRAYLRFVCELKEVQKSAIAAHVEDIIRTCGLSEVAHRLIGHLSKGYRQRVGFAQALIGNPDVLILDEPTVGLDPKEIIEIRNLIRTLGETHTVILSTHILPEVQAVCDKIVVIDKGKLVANDTAENLSHNLSADHKLTVQIEGPTKEVKSLLEQIPQMVEVHLNRTIDKTIGEYELNAQEGCDIRREVFKRMAARNYPILLMRSSELTLEEIFLKLTTGDFYGNIDNGGAAR